MEKPEENFSCASSLGALTLHEHYVELRLLLTAAPAGVAVAPGTASEKRM